jgi:hypothetical protein
MKTDKGDINLKDDGTIETNQVIADEISEKLVENDDNVIPNPDLKIQD